MAAKHKVTVSVQPTNRRLTAAERRAAEVASLSTRQAELKQESAERRAKRAGNEPPATTTRAKSDPRRNNSR